MSESNSGASRSITTEESNSGRSKANNTHGRKRNKKLWRKKKKGNHSTHTAKIHRATLELKRYYVDTYEEVIRIFVEESFLHKKIHKEKDIVALDKLIQKNVCNFGALKRSSYSTLDIRLKLYSYL